MQINRTLFHHSITEVVHAQSMWYNSALQDTLCWDRPHPHPPFSSGYFLTASVDSLSHPPCATLSRSSPPIFLYPSSLSSSSSFAPILFLVCIAELKWGTCVYIYMYVWVCVCVFTHVCMCACVCVYQYMCGCRWKGTSLNFIIQSRNQKERTASLTYCTYLSIQTD